MDNLQKEELKDSLAETMENENDISLEKELTQEKMNKERLEKIEQELKEAEIYLKKISDISHESDFKGDIEYTKKLQEISNNNKENSDMKTLIKNKVYLQEIKNLIDAHDKALNIIFIKTNESNLDYSLKQDLESKSNDLSKQKTILERHIYDLGNYIKE